MTVLVSFVGGWGHCEPLLPVAAVAARRGHEVVFAGQQAVLPRLRGIADRTHAVGPDTLAPARRPLVPVDREAERAVIRDHFVGRYGPHRAAALATVIDQERPVAVVCDEVDVGAVAAAELAGIPCVTVGVIAAGRLTSPPVVGPAWRRLRGDLGLPDDPRGERLGGTLALAPVPRSFRHPEHPGPPGLRLVRPAILDAVPARPTPGAPLVYATLGTVFNVESGDLLSRLVAGLSQLTSEVVVTTGPHIGRAELPDAPRRVRVEAFVPQAELLGRCAAVVCHGGSGTLVAALSLGVPVVVLPMGADQPDNADRCTDLGVGIVLDPLTAEPEAIADAVRAVTGDDRYRRAAARLAAEAVGQPAVGDVGELLAVLEPPARTS